MNHQEIEALRSRALQMEKDLGRVSKIVSSLLGHVPAGETEFNELDLFPLLQKLREDPQLALGLGELLSIAQKYSGNEKST